MVRQSHQSNCAQPCITPWWAWTGAVPPQALTGPAPLRGTSGHLQPDPPSGAPQTGPARTTSHEIASGLFAPTVSPAGTTAETFRREGDVVEMRKHLRR